jgi:hypothetical protein
MTDQMQTSHGQQTPLASQRERIDAELAVGVASVRDTTPAAAKDPEFTPPMADSTPEDDANPIAPVSDSDELLPGEVAQDSGIALLSSQTIERFRDRRMHLQLCFVDDPQTAAHQAGELVDEVVVALREAVDQQRSLLEKWQSGQDTDAHSGDTELLRVAVRMYRDFMDRLLGL